MLQEAQDSSFSGATEVYSGINTFYLVSGRGPTRYYYRVKARNQWGDSNWSNVRSADVVWELEPNDEYQEANGPLISGVEYYGYPDDAYDHFKIYLDASGEIEVDLENHTGQGVQLQLHYQSVPNRVGYDWDPPYQIRYTNASPGWYYIRIYTESGHNSDTSYVLRATFP